MNRSVQRNFDEIKGAANAYKDSVVLALTENRNTVQRIEKDAAAYKDEAAYIAPRKAGAIDKARADIGEAHRQFTSTVNANVSKLRDELTAHILVQPSPALINVIDLYNKYNLTATRSDVSALLSMAGGSTLGLRCINAMLLNTDSNYRVSFPSIDSYEKDLESMMALPGVGEHYAPIEFHHENVALWKDTPVMTRNGDGSTTDSGMKWSSANLLTAGNAFESRIKALDDVAARWADNVIPTVYDSTLYDEDGAAQFVADRNATAKSAEINPADNSAARGRAIGQTIAASEARAIETVAHYTK